MGWVFRYSIPGLGRNASRLREMLSLFPCRRCIKRLSFRYRLNSCEDAMSGLLIKDFPPELHRKLKDEAARHHRSMTRQALALLEQALSSEARNAAELLPKPLKPAKPVTASNVVAVIREGRDSGKSSLSK